MAKKKAAEPKRRTKVQEPLPEMGQIKNERIHAAALDYLDEMTERVKATAKETAAHEHLMRVMGAENVTEYSYGDLVVLITGGKQKVKVKKVEDKPKKGKKKKSEDADSDDE